MNMGKTRQASFLYLAAALLLTTCDVFGPSLEETLDYNRGIYPVTTWDELRAAVDTVPDGITIVVAKDLTADSVMEIPNNKRITIAAYRDRTVTIRRNTSPSFTAAVFYINSTNASLTLGDSKHGGTLILDGGAKNVSPIDAANSLVRAETGSLTIEAGAVLQNNSGSGFDGGAVYADGSFIMNGGIIRDNHAANGGAVSGSNFTMTGGTIIGNTANHGGGVYVPYGTFTMNGGTISSNIAASFGGGVRAAAEVTMFNGTISGNTAGADGGGVCVDGLFTMNNGTISGNTANSNGGGVAVLGAFTKSGGIIYGSEAAISLRNTATVNDGAAVFVDNYSAYKYRNTSTGPGDNLTGGDTWSGTWDGGVP
jgi:hypothetical protein